MDKIKKFLRKLRKKEREALLLLLLQIKKDHTKIPGISRLKGHRFLYRVRLGQYRIIFFIKKGIVEIRRISRRHEDTYKDL